MTMRLLNQYYNEQEAYIDQGYLESNGINAEVDSNAISDIFPGSTAGTYNLYVDDRDYARAKELMDNR